MIFLILALLSIDHLYVAISDAIPFSVSGITEVALGGALLLLPWQKNKTTSSLIGNNLTPQKVGWQSHSAASVLAPPTAGQEMPIPNQPKWIKQWSEVKNLNIATENDHFFLERRYLDDFSKELISHAKSSLLIANPFIQPCDLSDMLRTAGRQGVAIQIITRHPTGKTPAHRAMVDDYHLMLISDGISITYNDRSQANLIIADNALAVVSSMNFANSFAEASLEAGLVTMNSEVVKSIAESFSAAFNNNL